MCSAWIAEKANQDAALSHAGVEGHQVAIAADEEQRGDQQHHGDGDLGDDHQALHGEALAAAGASALAGLERADRVDAGGAHRGKGAKDDAGEPRDRGGEEQHAPVGDDGEMNRILAGVERRNQQAAQGLRERDAERRSAEGKQAALDEQLRGDAAARCSEGHADGHLALAGAGAGEHQVGQVGAGDEQDQSGDGEQELKRGVVGVAQRADAGACRICGEAEGHVVLDRLGAVAGGRGVFEEAGAERIKVGRGALDGPAGLEASHDVEEEHLGANDGRRAGGIGEIEAISYDESGERRRRDAQHLHRAAFGLDGGIRGNGFAAHLRLPIWIADDDLRQLA